MPIDAAGILSFWETDGRPMTPEERQSLMDANTFPEWVAAEDAIQAAHGGKWPANWVEESTPIFFRRPFMTPDDNGVTFVVCRRPRG